MNMLIALCEVDSILTQTLLQWISYMLCRLIKFVECTTLYVIKIINKSVTSSLN